MPMFKSGYSSNPKVGMMHDKMAGHEPAMGGMDGMDGKGKAKSYSVHHHDDGTAHSHIHHADDTHEHTDHASAAEAHDHVAKASGEEEGQQGTDGEEEMTSVDGPVPAIQQPKAKFSAVRKADNGAY
jgi:hypothetical protein